MRVQKPLRVEMSTALVDKFPGGGGDSHMKLTGMLVGKLELNP